MEACLDDIIETIIESGFNPTDMCEALFLCPWGLHANTAPNVVFYILSRDRIRQNKRRNVLLFEFIQVSGNLVDIEVNSSAVQLPYYGNSLPSLKRWVCRDDIYIKKILLICITFISQNGILIFFFMGILTTLLWVLGTEKSGLK